MTEFQFDESLSPEENIELFFGHLRSIDPELTPLLEAHLDKMLPLPESPQSRSAARTAFNREVDQALNETDRGSEETPQ